MVKVVTCPFEQVVVIVLGSSIAEPLGNWKSVTRSPHTQVYLTVIKLEGMQHSHAVFLLGRRLQRQSCCRILKTAGHLLPQVGLLTKLAPSVFYRQALRRVAASTINCAQTPPTVSSTTSRNRPVRLASML